jgi:RHS repeat-associated protein
MRSEDGTPGRRRSLAWTLMAFLLQLPPGAAVLGVGIDTSAYPVGRLTSAGNGQARRFYQYDLLGRAVSTEHRLDGGGYVFATTFGYPQGSGTAGPGTVVRSQTFPDGEVTAFGYDAAGAQRTIVSTRTGTVTPQDVVRDVRRNARGQTVLVVYGNGAASSHTYNETTDLRLNRIQMTNGSGLIQDYLYGFDGNGNVTSLSDGIVPSFSATYAYDTLDRLTSMTSGSVFSYQYDSVGNLINKEGTVQTYGGTGRGPHALAGAGGTTRTYDFNGNLASTSGGLALTWNAENMATQASLGGVTQNRKSFLGEELWKKVEGGTTTLYLPSLLLENGVPRKLFGAFAERSPDGTLKFYHGDHLGSSTVVTDASQAVIHRIAYMPYGADRGVAGGSFTPRYQFNFKEKESTGFYDYGARLYDPATGRWLSADSSLDDGANRYAYVNDNPLAYVDPTGHQSSPFDVWDDVAGLLTGLRDGILGFLANPARIPHSEMLLVHLQAKEGFRDHGYYLNDGKVTFGIGSTFPVKGHPGRDLQGKLRLFGITEGALRSGQAGVMSFPQARFIAITHPDLVATASALRGGNLTSFSFIAAASIGYQWGGGTWQGLNGLARADGILLANLLRQGDDLGASQVVRSIFGRLIAAQPQYARGHANRRDDLIRLLRVSSLLRPPQRIDATPTEIPPLR